MIRHAWRVALASALFLTTTSAVASSQPSALPDDVAQTQEAPARLTARPARLEVAVLAGFAGGADLGEGRARTLGNETPNSPPVALFVTRSRISSSPLVEGRVGLQLSRHVSVEGGVSLARPSFDVDVSGDVEGVPPVTASTKISEIVADGALMYRWRGRRFSPFVLGGAGYLRQLDDPRTTVETGTMFFGGGGVLMALAPGSKSFARRLSLRGDLRLTSLSGGITLQDERRNALVASGGIVLGL